MRIDHEEKEEEAVSIETLVPIARAIDCDLSQKERRPRRADTIIDL